MAAQFVGLTVRVTLQGSQEEKLIGQVKEVGAGQKLILKETRWQGRLRNEYAGEVVIPVDRIADVVIVENGNGNGANEAMKKGQSRPSQQPQILPRNNTALSEGRLQKTQEVKQVSQVKPAFVDPAIVTYQRTSQNEEVSSQVKNTNNGQRGRTPIPTTQEPTQEPAQEPSPGKENVRGLSLNTLFDASAKEAQRKAQPQQIVQNGAAGSATATLTEPFSQMALDVSGIKQDPRPQPVRKDFLQPKTNRGRGGRNLRGIQREVQAQEPEYTAPPASTKKNKLSKRARLQARNQEDQSGWATGEVSDIHDMGDFDFEENLSKFDKRKVFDEIRQGDTTADEDRLYFSNLKARPGTAGGKNLHYTENVLDSPKQMALEESSADDGFQRASSRRGSERSIRKPLPRKILSRPQNHFNNTDAHLTGTGSLQDIHEAQPMERVSSSLSARRTPITPSRRTSTQPSGQFSLIYSSTGRTCPTLTPLQMLELEQLAISEYGISDEILVENAARSIADATTSLLQTSNSSSSPPIIILLAGNTKTGARAISAARHLRNRRAKVILCLLGFEIETNLLEPVKRQYALYCDTGGRPVRPDQLSRTVNRMASKDSQRVIVDALFGIHLHFNDLAVEEQAAFNTLSNWSIAQLQAWLIAVDTPSGVDAATGSAEATLSAGGVPFQTDCVLCLGAPKTGLLSAATGAELEGVVEGGQVFRSQDRGNAVIKVLDIGIANEVWKRFGRKGGKGVEFGLGSAVNVGFADG